MLAWGFLRAHYGAKEDHHEAIKVYPVLLDAHAGAVELTLELAWRKEAQPRATEVHTIAKEPLPESMKAHGRNSSRERG